MIVEQVRYVTVPGAIVGQRLRSGISALDGHHFTSGFQRIRQPRSGFCEPTGRRRRWKSRAGHLPRRITDRKRARMSRVFNHFRSNVVAYVALFVALGGTSYAAVNLPAGSVGNRQLKNHSVTPIKLDPGSIAGYVRDWA